VKMHREIMGAPKGKDVDHINHIGVCNVKSNLRCCTRSENQHNRKPNKKVTSKFKGVCWSKDYKKWISQIKINKKSIKLGLFASELEAAIEYNKAAKIHFKEFAYLNDIK